jgi:hypothetical protein
MSLTDDNLRALAKRMGMKLEAVVYKSQLEDMTLEYNKAYIINLDDEYAADGSQNSGTHYVALQVSKNNKNKIEPCYCDSYGVAPPKEVLDFVGVKHVPYNTKCIQSLISEVCGYYALAFFYFINKFEKRSGNIYHDCEEFTSLFNDLNTSSEWKANELMLKSFFQSTDPEYRRTHPIEVFTDFKVIHQEGQGSTNVATKSIQNDIDEQED